MSSSHYCNCTCTPPSWEVLVLVANHLDPKTLSIASCVSKPWSISMSSDHLWQPICATHFPSLSNLLAANPTMPHRRLYALGHAAAKRRLKKPPKPLLSLKSLTFIIDVSINNSKIVTIVKHGRKLKIDPNRLFRFDFIVYGENYFLFDVLRDLKVTWNVVLEGYKGVFTMMNCKGKEGSGFGLEGNECFSEKLPWPECCSSGGASGFSADLGLGLRGVSSMGEKMMVRRVTVGVLSMGSWRYVSIDDVLRYLQHFLPVTSGSLTY